MAKKGKKFKMGGAGAVGVGFEFKGMQSLQRKLQKLSSDSVEGVTKKVLYNEAEKIMKTSKDKFVPVMDGNLRASGQVELPKKVSGKIRVQLGYGNNAVPYAIIVHENPRSGRTMGKGPSGGVYKNYAKVGQWKYLEIPFNEARTRVISELKREYKAEIRRLSRG
jgi:hypothetical protein